jgi:hypothetical protein
MLPSDFSPARRRFLGAGTTGTLVALAGCLDALETGGRVGGETGPTLRFTLAPGPETLRDRYLVDLSETRPERDQEAFAAALDGEPYTTQHRRPFPAGGDVPRYVERDGTYYRLGSVVVDEVAVRRPVVRLAEAPAENGQATADAVAAEQLPDVDRRAVQIAHMAARARGDEGGVPWELVERGGYVYRREEAIETSRLVAGDGPATVTYRERRYAVEVSEELFYEPVYRPTIEPVATSPERLEEILRVQVVDARIDPDELSQEAQGVIRGATQDSYREQYPFSSEYQSVLRALDARAYLDGDVENDALGAGYGAGTLRYGADYFEYRLRFDRS